MARATFSKQPSPYPSLAFHLIRLGQVLSSIIVTSILGFFIHHLSVDLYYVPWTFLLVRISSPKATICQQLLDAFALYLYDHLTDLSSV